jgi:hypothetical protein
MTNVQARGLASTLLLFAALAGCGGRAGLDTGSETNGSGSTTSTSAACSGGGCTTGASCNYQGGTYPSGFSWTCDGCGNTCTCQDGLISTTGNGCVSSSTGYTTTYYATSSGSYYYGTSSGGFCYYGSNAYSNGSIWACGCSVCSCSNGSIAAFGYDGGCISTTTSTTTTFACTYGGSVEPNGATWYADGGGCGITCMCDAGTVACTQCPACWYNGVTYASGDAWTCSDGCNTCRCSSGQVIATAVPCYGGEGGITDGGGLE